MTYFSHSKKTKEGKVEGSKYLRVHIEGVTNKAIKRLHNQLDLGFEEEELIQLITLIGKLHDLGKYTTYFQNYLLQQEPVDHYLKQHARIGGIVAYNMLKDNDHKVAITALYLIFLHHSGLFNIEDFPEKIDENAQKVFELQKADIEDVLPQISIELFLEDLKSHLVFPDNRVIRKEVKVWTKREASIQDYYVFNYLFSLLIEADKLDASDTLLYQNIHIESKAVDKRFSKPAVSLETDSLDQLSNNELRNYCRAKVVENLEREDILEHYLFTLTAPTGIGKTMTALDFALKLKDKVRQTEEFEAPIIYALPFINIIEQALHEYKQTLPPSTKILGHYQYADVFGNKEDNDEHNYNQKLMSLDTWQGDVVITSFVQFFETLIGNRNKLLKKFNHLAGAIIILDEVQTLRLDQMPLIGAALYYLTKFLKARVVLMTATKPKIFELAQKEILDKEEENIRPLELLQNNEEVFKTFNRTCIIPLLGFTFDQESICTDFVETIFSNKWSKNKSCLVVCNTVKRSIELFDAISEFLADNDLENPIFYLSTNVVPAHRFERIEKIKQVQKDNLCPILIATQVVEAGVDLDFDMGFRDVGPIDSIIQVAGRVNRNNNPEKINSPLYIVDFKDGRRIYGAITYQQTLFALQQQEQFPEQDYLQLVSAYFDNISNRSAFNNSRNIFQSMKQLRYDSHDESDFPVSSFKIIEDSNMSQSVFIEFGEYEADLSEKYLLKIKGEISKEEFDKNYRREFQQRIITVPDQLTRELDNLNDFEDNIKIVPHVLLNQYYQKETGYIRNQQQTFMML